MGMLACIDGTLLALGSPDGQADSACDVCHPGIERVVEPMPGQNAQYLEEGKVMVRPGTGNRSLRLQLLRFGGADRQIVLKATKVDGVYSADPRRRTQTLPATPVQQAMGKKISSNGPPRLPCAATRSCLSRYSVFSNVVLKRVVQENGNRHADLLSLQALARI
jgi:hypothetical protein